MLNPTVTRTIFGRGFKNFGHKRQPESTFTVLWHGFLTFTFIGMGIEWKKISSYIFGDNETTSSPLEVLAISHNQQWITVQRVWVTEDHQRTVIHRWK